MSESIGYICLNIALVLYLIHYLPQLIHNRNAINRSQMNVHFHGLLSICYLCDLTFAFGMNMPWQYCLVSVIGTLCLLAQHYQLKNLDQQKKLLSSYQMLISFFSLLFFISIYIKLPQPFFLLIGYISQVALWTYTLPQIWQNYIYKQGRGLNKLYLSMNLACSSLDVIASISLSWPMPAKIGALFGLACTSILLYQTGNNQRNINMVEEMT